MLYLTNKNNCINEDTNGLWNYEKMPPPVSIQTYEPVTAQFQTFNELLQPVGKIWPSFVFINCFFPHNVDGLRYLEVNDLFFFLK